MTDRTQAREQTLKIELLGMPIASITRSEAVDHLARELSAGRGGWMITANVDYLQRYAADPAVAALYRQADLIVADGMPVVWAARLQRTPLPDRVAGSDMVWLVSERAAREGYSIYLLGGDRGAAETAARRFTERWPGLRVVGVSSPAVSIDPSTEEIEDLCAIIKTDEPDVVFVALGAPKEERVIAALRKRFPRTWWIGVGVSFSFVAGYVKRAPRWMQRFGFEWLHRLAQEPRRLAGRYLFHNLPFTARLLIRAWRGRS